MSKKETEPEISIVVPVYNVKHYLRECLDSILHQTFEDWECLLVDDGSTDGSGDICNEYASRDARFRVIHKQNGGLSSARNAALREVRGRYVAFCDSDDWMEPQMLATLHRLAVDYDADVAQSAFYKDYPGYKHKKVSDNKIVVLDRDEALVELAKDKKVKNYMWNKLFRREIVGPDFPEGMNFEDIYTGVKWFARINRMVCDPTPLYHYRKRKGSIVNARFYKNRIDFVKAVIHRVDEMLRLGVKDFTKADRDKYVIRAIVSGAKVIARKETDSERRDAALREIHNMLLHTDMPDKKKLGGKLRFRAELLRRNPRLFANWMRFTALLDLHSHLRTRKLYD